jgi:3-hydroxybutyryl-CoA dehydratase
MQNGKTIDQLAIGDRATLSKQITEADVLVFATITGDRNPIHLDPAYAIQTRFKERIAHGILTAGLISAVIGTILPGPGNIYVSQTLEFRAPVRLGDTVRAEVEVIEKVPERNRVRLRTICSRQDGTIVIDGEAVVIPRRA